MPPYNVARRLAQARPASLAAVSWRDGVHLHDTPIWCDARRRRDVCFVSAADRVGRTGHGQLIATPLTLALLDATPDGHLAAPLHRRFTLGTTRLELVASGRGIGAAGLLVDVAGRAVLYAGTVRSVAGPGAPLDGIAEAEVRTCDAVVVAARHGEHRRRFPPLARVIEQVIDWTRAQIASGRHAVLVVETALDGLEVAGQLCAAGLAIAGSSSLRVAARRAATAGHRLDVAAPGRQPGAWLCTEAEQRGLSRALAGRRHSRAVVSARAVDGVDGADIGFAWPNASDRPRLLEWIEATSARAVFLTGEGAEALASTLGPRARVLGPPRQMALFPRTAV